MKKLLYITGYAIDQYEANELYTLSNILQMELLLMREQETNKYQMSPLTISQLRDITANDLFSYFSERCNQLMSFLNIGEFHDEGQTLKPDLLLRYPDPEDRKLLDQLFQDFKDNSYGDEMVFILDLKGHSYLTDEDKMFIKDKFVSMTNHIGNLMECVLKVHSYEFSDGTIVCPIAHQYTYELYNVFGTFLGGIEKIHHTIVRRKDVIK